MSTSSTSDNQVTCDEMMICSCQIMYIFIHVVQCWFFGKPAFQSNMFILRATPVSVQYIWHDNVSSFSNTVNLQSLLRLHRHHKPNKSKKQTSDLILLLCLFGTSQSSSLTALSLSLMLFSIAVFLCLEPQLNSSAFFWSTLDSCENHS